MVPGRVGVELCRERAQPVVELSPGHRLDQLGHRFVIEAGKLHRVARDATAFELRDQGRKTLVFVRKGVSSGADQQCPGALGAAGHVTEEGQRRTGCPMGIIEHHHQRPATAGHRNPGTNCLEKPMLVELWTGRPRGNQPWQAGPDLRHESDELGGSVAEPIDQLIVGDARHIPLQGFEEGLIGPCEILLAPTEENDVSCRVGTEGDLRGQPGLADPGLTDDPEHRQPVAGGVGQQALSELELGIPADEGP